MEDSAYGAYSQGYGLDYRTSEEREDLTMKHPRDGDANTLREVYRKAEVSQ